MIQFEIENWIFRPAHICQNFDWPEYKHKNALNHFIWGSTASCLARKMKYDIRIFLERTSNYNLKYSLTFKTFLRDTLILHCPRSKWVFASITETPTHWSLGICRLALVYRTSARTTLQLSFWLCGSAVLTLIPRNPLHNNGITTQIYWVWFKTLDFKYRSTTSAL